VSVPAAITAAAVAAVIADGFGRDPDADGRYAAADSVLTAAMSLLLLVLRWP